MFEDSVEKLCMDHIRKPLDILLPKLIALFTCPEEMVKNVYYMSNLDVFVNLYIDVFIHTN
jgi:hypothetical protein